MSNIATILLAAGGSSRMNQSKQLLLYHGKSLLRHAAEIAVTANLGPVFIVLGYEADRLQQEIEGLPVQCIVNTEWQKGIGTSIRAGVRAVAANTNMSALIFMLCDQPLIDADILHQLAQTFTQSRQPIVASRYGDTFGVPALFDRSYFPQLLSLKDNEGAKRIIQSEAANAVFLPAPQAAIDLDTPDDCERLRAGLD